MIPLDTGQQKGRSSAGVDETAQFETDAATLRLSHSERNHSFAEAIAGEWVREMVPLIRELRELRERRRR